MTLNKKDLIKRQPEDYKNGMTKYRSVPLLLNDFDRDDVNFILEHQREFSKLMYDNRETIDFKRRDTADHLFDKEVKSLIEKHGYSLTFVHRQLIRPVLRSYKSYIIRNKTFPKKPIQIKYKSLAAYDGCVRIDKKNNKVNFQWYTRKIKDPVVSTYVFPGTTENYKKYIKEKSGGNLKFIEDKTYYMIKVDIPVTWKYKPIDWLSYDCNKTKEVFLQFSKPITLFGETSDVFKKNHPELKRALSLEKQLLELNSIEKKKSKIRNKIKLKHKYHERAYRKFVKELVDYVESNKMCLLMDLLGTGQKNGTFGQDKIKELILKECENRGVPHVLVPTPYTTKLCSKCDHMHDKILLSQREFICEGCGEELIRDKNSADNIEKRGKLMWEIGTAEVENIFKSKYGLSMFRN
jgi:transposase